MDTNNYNVVDGFNLIAPAYDLALANDAITKVVKHRRDLLSNS